MYQIKLHNNIEILDILYELTSERCYNIAKIRVSDIIRESINILIS